VLRAIRDYMVCSAAHPSGEAGGIRIRAGTRPCRRPLQGVGPEGAGMANTATVQVPARRDALVRLASEDIVRLGIDTG